jgi:N-acyl homoserine lactone hydrolase
MKISVVSTGRVKIKTRFYAGKGAGFLRKLNVMLDKEFTPDLPVNAYLLEHEEGNILIDCGELEAARRADYYPAVNRLFIKNASRFYITQQDEIGPALERNKIHPQDISKVVLTHLHQDHMNGLGYFTGATVIIGGREYRDFCKKSGFLNGYMRAHFPAGITPLLADFTGEPFGPFEHSFRVTKDGSVRMVPTPGHTMGHCAVIAVQDGVYYFFAGDSAFSQKNLLHRTIDGVCMNYRKAGETLDKIRRFAREYPTVFLPSHDPAAAARLKEKEIIPQQERSGEKAVAASASF